MPFGNRKYLLLATIILLTQRIDAQFVFNSCASHPAYGDSLTGNLIIYDTTGVSSGTAGANITWNYSTVSQTSSWPLSHTYFDPAATEGSYMFPNADVADRNSNGVYSYFENSADSVTFFGDYHDSVTFHQSWDPQKNMMCSFTFGNIYSDFFSRYNFSQCPYHHTYTNRTITYDGYGTIILPDDTFQVARIKIVENTLDTAICIGPAIISNWVDTTYVWYDINSGQPVFSWHYFYDFTNVYKNIIIQEYAYSHLPAIVSGIDEPGPPVPASAYPNPVNGTLIVSPGEWNGSGSQLELRNILGQVIYSAPLSGSEPMVKVNMAGQPEGIYVLILESGSGQFTQKVIVAR